MQNSTNKLKRDLDLTGAVAVGLGAVIGAGIFVVTGLAAGLAGPAFLLGMLIAGFAATCNGLSSAKLASVYPASGGTYEYGYQVLNPATGFAAGWTFLLSKLSAGGVVALGFGSYLSQLIPGVNPQAAALTAIAILTLANLAGIKKVGRMNQIIVSVTILGLLYFIISGLGAFKPENLIPFAPSGWRSVLQSAGLLFFAFTGYARITTLGGEVQEPKKTIPRAVIITLIASVILYSLVGLAAVGSVGSAALAGSSAPLEAAARQLGTPGITTIIGLAACTAMLGVLLSQILGISRMMYAMSERSDLPRFFSRVSPTGVPALSIGITAAIIAILVMIGSIPVIARTATFAILLYYTLANLAALRMKEGKGLFPDWISWAGLIACLVMALTMDWTVIASGLGILLAGFLLRFVVQKAGK
ncbi:APC family permease [Proteiniclasticum sp. QWL-01]|uniref:APC family permease n=1 Tax=Proteiniclasticum sp. QWL-01 TaxID=3036945 RepID=UPI0024117561|nr:APC family permease [Proteiniclasticum sp. QWL-01]WFF73263.1 APC family permease [Proteiniclasticum sp. QWL-01]